MFPVVGSCMNQMIGCAVEQQGAEEWKMRGDFVVPYRLVYTGVEVDGDKMSPSTFCRQHLRATKSGPRRHRLRRHRGRAMRSRRGMAGNYSQ